jgi:hypothetical protein
VNDELVIMSRRKRGREGLGLEHTVFGFGISGSSSLVSVELATSHSNDRLCQNPPWVKEPGHTPFQSMQSVAFVNDLNLR